MANKVSNLPRLLLYKRDASPPSCAVMMLGDLLGLKFEYKEPDLIKMEHMTTEFKKLNPMETIPVLQDGDFIVSERLLSTFFHGLKGPTPEHIADIDKAYSVVEAYLHQNRYIAGDRFTIADISLGSTVIAMQAIHELDIDKYPRSVKWLSRLKCEDCFKKINEPGVANFSRMLNTFWKKNSK